MFVVLACFCFFGAWGPEKKEAKQSRKSSPNPPKSTANDPLGLLKGPIGASLRLMHSEEQHILSWVAYTSLVESFLTAGIFLDSINVLAF